MMSMEEMLARAVYVLAIFGGGLLVFVIKRAYHSIGLLFSKYDELAADNLKLKLAIMKLDPALYLGLFGKEGK